MSHLGTRNIGLFGANALVSCQIINCYNCGVEVLGSGCCSTVRCDVNNISSGNYSGSFGGQCNTSSGYGSVVLGGKNNLASGDYSFSSGLNNIVSGCYSGAFGCGLNASSNCTFYSNNFCACGSLYTSAISCTCAVCVGANGQLIGYTPIVPPPATNYGLFAQTANSSVISGTTVETTLIDGGVGILSVPANGFSVGDSFNAVFAGMLSSKNGDSIRIRVKSGSVVLADSGTQTLPTSTNAVWSLSIYFTIRAIGGAGVASIVTLGNFLNIKQSNNTSEGFAFNTLNNTTFDTTIGNTLDVTAQWSSTSPLNSIYSDNFVLNKIY